MKKTERFLIRDEIEKIVRSKNISENSFAEYSKTGYQEVITRFRYAFTDNSEGRNPGSRGNMSDISFSWNHIRKGLSNPLNISLMKNSWAEMLDRVRDVMRGPADDRLFLIMEEGWVYFGKIDEIMTVLKEAEGLITASYLFSTVFDRLAVYADDADCMSFYRKG